MERRLLDDPRCRQMRDEPPLPVRRNRVSAGSLVAIGLEGKQRMPSSSGAAAGTVTWDVPCRAMARVLRGEARVGERVMPAGEAWGGGCRKGERANLEQLWTKRGYKRGELSLEMLYNATMPGTKRYRCLNCGHRFEAEVLTAAEDEEYERENRPRSQLRCPACRRSDWREGWE